MTEAIDFRRGVFAHKKLNEWMLAASIMGGVGPLARQSCSWLRPEMLSDARLQKMWTSVLENGDGVRAINEQGLTLDVSKYISITPDLTRYEEYARAVAEDYYFIQAGESVGKIAMAINNRNLPELQAEIEKMRVVAISGNSCGRCADEIGLEFEESVHHGFHSIKTWITDLDAKIGGLFEGEFTTVAARPGCGKTALALQIARTSAAKGRKVDFFSLEMGAAQLWARLACPDAGVEWQRLRLGEVTAVDKDAVVAASQKYRKLYGTNLRIIDDVFTVEGIHRVCAADHPDIVIIDQLGEFRWHDPKESRVSYYGKIIKNIRAYIAKDLRVPVLMLHHINRAPEGREDGFPTLSDLRDSGEVENKSDVVWLCHRRDLKDGRAVGQTGVPFEIRIGKNRQGEAGGKITLEYNLDKQWFT